MQVTTSRKQKSWAKISPQNVIIAPFHILGAVHILRNTLWGGGGLPDLLQYYIGGGLPNLLQYYIRGGGVSWEPKVVLRNIWMAPKFF